MKPWASKHAVDRYIERTGKDIDRRSAVKEILSPRVIDAMQAGARQYNHWDGFTYVFDGDVIVTLYRRNR